MVLQPGNKIGAGLGNCYGGPGLSEKAEIREFRLQIVAVCRSDCKFQITNHKYQTNHNDGNWSFGLPTLRAGPQFQNSKSVLVI